MISSLKNKLLKHTAVTVVGLHFKNEGVVYNVLKVSQEKNKLLIIEQSSYDTFDALEKAVDNKSPVILNFSGKGVLNKKTANVPDYKSKALLNVDKNDFYFYEHLQKKHVFISVIRKEKVQEYISLFNASNYLIIDYSIGPFITSLLAYVTEKESFIANTTELFVSENKLSDFKITQEKSVLTIDDQELSEKETVLLGSAINYFQPSEEFVYDKDFLIKNKEEASFKKYYQLLGMFILGGFFVLLLLSYLLLGHYNDKVVNTNSSIQSVQETFDIIKELQSDRDNKREILNESGVFTNRFLSFYANELTTNLPSTITLSEFHVFPYSKKVKPLEKIKFNENSITLKGESASNINFNNWYKGLKKVEWISKLDIIVYKSNKSNNYDFEIKLMIK
ncbi:hypothetical protein [Lacinutrix sp. Hel_I_90]|uniref:hypothetical protein n=1 Tax=Lacinutrix sp. Hel_I_90 TaxID=1249999 RepID=UPI0005CA17CF|nr:hypothetical protein [Lacinutrix sp. Hel_I_90]